MIVHLIYLGFFFLEQHGSGAVGGDGRLQEGIELAAVDCCTCAPLTLRLGDRSYQGLDSWIAGEDDAYIVPAQERRGRRQEK